MSPVSVLMITEKCGRQAKTLVGLLERVLSTVPQILRDMAQQQVEIREADKTAPLCHILKAYGQCK